MTPVSNALGDRETKERPFNRKSREGERSIERREMCCKYECSQHEVTYWI